MKPCQTNYDLLLSVLTMLVSLASSNPIGDEGARAFAAVLPRCPNLRSLKYVGARGVQVGVDSRHYTPVRSVPCNSFLRLGQCNCVDARYLATVRGAFL